jgi:hypothetical protein
MSIPTELHFYLGAFSFRIQTFDVTEMVIIHKMI